MSRPSLAPCSHPRLARGLALTLALFLAAAVTLARAEERKRDFQIPAGRAENTLRQFAEQAAIQFVFSSDKVKGVLTNDVNGQYTAREALNRLVAGTELRVVQDDSTGALTVDRPARSRISNSSYVAKKKIP